MSNKNDIFDDLIKSQLEGFEANVSMADWDAIEAKLPAQKRKKVAAYWWLTGLALLVVGVLTATFWEKFSDTDTTDEVVFVADDQATQKESVVKNNYIPTPNEAPSEKTVNEPNQPENLNTEINTTTSSEVETKTSVQSTTEPDNLPTNNVDIKADDDRIKGAADSAFSTDPNEQLPNKDIADPVNEPKPLTIVKADSSKPGNTIDPIKPSTRPKWEIAISASPNWAGKLFAPNGDNAWRINKEYENIAKTMESGSVSYQVEAKLNRYLNENIYLNAGLNYNQIQERINYNYQVTEMATEREAFKDLQYVKINPNIGPIKIKYSGTNTYHYFEAPVRVGYASTLPGTKLNLRVETGLRYMVLADMNGQRTDVTRIDSLVDLKSALDDYSRHNLGATANVGMYWPVWNGKGDFGVTTYYNHALTSIRKRDEGITEKPYNFGVNFTLQRKLWIK